MRELISYIVLAIFGLIAASQSSLAQETQSEPHEDFTIANLASLSLTGIHTETTYSLRDAQGIEYDIYSLLKRKDVRVLASVSEEQFMEIFQRHQEMTDDLGATVITASYSEEHQDTIKAKFMEVENEIRNSLDQEQLKKLEQARIITGLNVVGPQYLANEDVAKKLGLSTAAATAISEKGEELTEQLTECKTNLLRQANEKLLASLTDQQQARIKELLSEKTMETFLEKPLFINEVRQRKSIKLYAKSFLMARLKSAQRNLKMTENQCDAIAELKKASRKPTEQDLETSLGEILDTQQLPKLFELVVGSELKSRGTVSLLSKGVLGQFAGFTDEEFDTVFETGKRLHSELSDQEKQACHDLVSESFDLPAKQAEQITELFLRRSEL